jgi:hypothetical protein
MFPEHVRDHQRSYDADGDGQQSTQRMVSFDSSPSMR